MGIDKKKSLLDHEILNALTALNFMADELPEEQGRKVAGIIHMAGLMVKYEPLILGEAASGFLEALSLKELVDLVLTVNEDTLREAIVTAPTGDLKVKADRNQLKELLNLLIAILLEDSAEINFEIEKKSLRISYKGHASGQAGKTIKKPAMDMLACLQKRDMQGFQLGLIEALGKLSAIKISYGAGELVLSFS